MSIKKKSKTIESKITLYFIFFVVIIFAVLWISLIIFFNYSYGYYQVEKIYNIADSIEATDSDSIDEVLDNLAHSNEVCIIKVADDATVTEYNTKIDGCGLTNRNEYISELIVEFYESKEDEIKYEFINEEEKVEAALLALKYEDENIFIYTNLKDISQITSIFQNQMLYLTILSILISIIASYFISKKIVEPITMITKKAKLLGTKEDITFKKNGIVEIDNLVDALSLAQSEIGKTHALKRDLMANVSHDLKTPLTMIKAYAEMCRDISYKDKNKLDEHLNIIIDETNRLTLLVNDILDMSKLQDKKDVAKKEKYDLTEEINKIVKKYEIIKETEDYKFIVDMPKKVIINADKGKINQVIYNLVNNAINYTGDDKTIYINVKKKTSSYYIEIKDTGKGIKEENINNIWEKYYKTDKNHKRNVVSSGIGLSIVKEIFLLHDFEYGVTTSPKGTTFYFIIK